MGIRVYTRDGREFNYPEATWFDDDHEQTGNLVVHGDGGDFDAEAGEETYTEVYATFAADVWSHVETYNSPETTEDLKGSTLPLPRIWECIEDVPEDTKVLDNEGDLFERRGKGKFLYFDGVPWRGKISDTFNSDLSPFTEVLDV